VDPVRQAIEVDGRPLGGAQPLVHLALHKPAGVTATVADRHAAMTVIALVPPGLVPAGTRLYPVGRLDRGSEGLLLLTNDGAWADRVIHPRHGVEREYAVAVDRPLGPTALAALVAGVPLEEGLARAITIRRQRPAETARLAALLDPPPAPGLAWYRIVLGQGWKRQVRRMLAAVGAPVRRLVRVRIGAVGLDELAAGAVRLLDAREVARLGASPRGPAGAAHARVARVAPVSPYHPGAVTASRPLVIAVDGPASSGKSSVGAAVAARLGYRFLDTGLLYRAVTWLALRRGVNPADGPAVAALVPEVDLLPDDDRRLTRVFVDGREVATEIQTAAVERHVSEVARQPLVRATLLPRQRAYAAGGGIVLAGRDIGTVILPGADRKVWLDASTEARAARRAKERGHAPGSPAADRILADLRRRDATDTGRAAAPARPAPDAEIVVTDALDFEQTVEAVLAIVRGGARGEASR
jgi:cytidylate kinase